LLRIHWSQLEGKMQDLQEKSKRSRGYNRKAFEKQIKQTGSELINEILRIKVLDPAMGSGHFLVEATDFLAHALVEALNREVVFEPSRKEWLIRNKTALYEESTDKDEIRWARRQIVERCIYGNFLDHHLKCGNSLIGARVEDLTNLPELKKKKKREKISAAQGVLFDISSMTVDLGLAVGNYFLIEDKLSNSLEDIKDKEKIYEDINRKWMGKWQAVADLWTSFYFGVELDSNLYKALSDYLLEKDKRIPEEWVKNFAEKASKIAKEKRFFHWELEFPEVFFDRQGKKLDNPGFDVVMGNPPYEEESHPIMKSYFQEKFVSVLTGHYDYFLFFIKVGVGLIRQEGRFSMILPHVYLNYPQFITLRKYLWFTTSIDEIVQPLKDVFDEAVIDNSIIVCSKRKQGNTKLSRKSKRGTSLIDIKSIKIAQQNLGYDSFDQVVVSNQKLIKRFKQFCITLGNASLTKSSQGITVYAKLQGKKKNYISLYKREETSEPVVRGRDIERYFLDWPGTFIEYGNWLWCPREIGFFELPKIFLRQTSDHLVATYYSHSMYCLDSLHSFIMRNKNYSPLYLTSILNSVLTNWYYENILNPEKGKVFAQIKLTHIRQLPIRRIPFTTPKKEREKLVEEGEELYESYLENGDWNSLLFFVDQHLKRQHIPDPELVKKHNADPLNKTFQINQDGLAEQSDVVHDILAFLAEKMIEYNKEKNKEVKGFLKWLEREAGAKVEDLTGKTKIKKYYENTLDDLMNVFKKNRKKLQIDPSRRDFQDRFSAEFDKSIQKLTPLKKKIEMTDHLIDQIVYKLYGLTEEEIRIVEESLQK